MKKYFPILLILVVTGLVSCLNLDPPCVRTINEELLKYLDTSRLNSDGKTIDAWLATRNITAIKDGSGLRYRIIRQGTGEIPCLGNVVNVDYIGSLMSDGSVFDSSDAPVDLPLSNLILGWQIGFMKLQKGSKAVFYIPSGLGYGAQSRPGIPANSILIFDIEFYDTK